MNCCPTTNRRLKPRLPLPTLHRFQDDRGLAHGTSTPAPSSGAGSVLQWTPPPGNWQRVSGAKLTVGFIGMRLLSGRKTDP